MPIYTDQEGTTVDISMAMDVTPIVGWLTTMDTTALAATRDTVDPVISIADRDVNHTRAVRGCCEDLSDRLGQSLCFELRWGYTVG